MSAPKVTVLMPVYNGERYLREAVQSMLDQTCDDFELLLIDDGSADESLEIARSFHDKRVVAVANGTNIGLVATLNKGLGLARGEYIARMDCDDLSRPERLACQAGYLDANREVAACGSWVRKFGSGKGKTCRYHADPLLLKCGLLFDTVVAHPAVMLRRKIFLEHAFCYDENYLHAEDYELWVRVANQFRLGNVARILLDYRLHPAQVSHASAAEQLGSAGKVRRSLLQDLGLTPTTEEFEIHQRISSYRINGEGSFFHEADAWLCRLKTANDKCKIYPEPYFSIILTERLVTLLKKMLEQKVFPNSSMLSPGLFKKTGLGWGFVAKFFLRSSRGEFIVGHD